MNRLPKFLLWLLLLIVLSAGGYSGYQPYRTRAQLARQLEQLDQTLSAQTSDAAVRADGILKGIEADVLKNRRQPQEVALLHRAEIIALRTHRLLDTLWACQVRLRQATGNANTAGTLRYQDETEIVTRLLGPGSRSQLALQQQLATYADTLRHFGLVNNVSLAPSVFARQSVVEALAALTEMQSAVVVNTTTVLLHLSTTVGAEPLQTQLVAVATAKSNVVAPGEKYRGQLLLVKSLSAKKMEMYCNGLPVTIAANGVGHVRFRTPTQPGPATWTASIHYHQHGRDTTFQVQVPYRVARH